MADADRGWTRSQRQLLQWQVTRHLDDGQQMAEEISAALDVDEEAVGEALKILSRDGLATTPTLTLSEVVPHQGHLTSRGRDQADQWRSASPGAQTRACVDAMLDWLGELDGSHARNSDELADNVRGHF